MENTLLVFEGHTEKKWFVVVDERLLGPVSGKEIALWVNGGEVSLASYLWQEGFSDWQRIYDVKDFEPLLPSAPSPTLMAQARSKMASLSEGPTKMPPPPGTEQRIWFAYINNSQYGPFSESEIRLMAEAGRVNDQTYLWKKGMADWQLATAIQEIQLPPPGPARQAAAGKGPSGRVDKRKTPRRPFEARILLTDGQEVGWAICRDVSVGGMQVLMDHVPGEVGTLLKLNINASGQIPAFACEGEIVRVLEDGRGFSFRFIALPDPAKKAIQSYIS